MPGGPNPAPSAPSSQASARPRERSGRADRSSASPTARSRRPPCRRASARCPAAGRGPAVHRGGEPRRGRLRPRQTVVAFEVVQLLPERLRGIPGRTEGSARDPAPPVPPHRDAARTRDSRRGRRGRERRARSRGPAGATPPRADRARRKCDAWCGRRVSVVVPSSSISTYYERPRARPRRGRTRAPRCRCAGRSAAASCRWNA